MKFASILAAIVLSTVAVSALPCGHSDHHNHNHEENKNYEDNSNNENKEINQSIGNVGSSSGGSGGGLLGKLLGDNILAGGILSENHNTNYVNQNARID